MNIFQKLTKRRIILLLVGFVLGFLTLLIIRAAAYDPPIVHHHANFALYVNGQKDEFKSFTFYEEVQACSGGVDPKTRVHMHDQNNSLVHVHAAGVTWGHFFANLGYGLTDKIVQTDAGVFTEDEDTDISFILNGQPVGSIANRLIDSEDVLLVNVGKDDAKTLEERFQTIPKTAGGANHKPDPASCSGSADISWKDRFKYAIGISEDDNGTPKQDHGDHDH